jgi:hypothetical protein
MTNTNDNNQQMQAQQSSVPLVKVDMDSADIPDLSDADVMPIELTTLYWTPENKGDEKRVYFDCFKTRLMPVLREGDEAEVLPCAFFYEKTADGIISLCNASKRLVAALEGNFVQRGTPLLITYMGKKKNTTNQFMGDSWSVKPLVPRGMLIAEKVAGDVAAKGNQTEVVMPEASKEPNSATKAGPGF